MEHNAYRFTGCNPTTAKTVLKHVGCNPFRYCDSNSVRTPENRTSFSEALATVGTGMWKSMVVGTPATSYLSLLLVIIRKAAKTHSTGTV